MLSAEATLPPVFVIEDEMEYCEVLVFPCDRVSSSAGFAVHTHLGLYAR